MTHREKSASIIVIGAGPAGLFTAYYLKKNGYENVTVLEKLGRVGGLCRTITTGGRSFDLGANYVTPAYKHVLELANEVGAKLYSEEPFVAMKVPKDGSRVSYQTIFSALRVYRGTEKTVPMPTFLRAMLRFLWIRFKLRKVIDRPTFESVHSFDGGSLCKRFDVWLADNGLGCLETVFVLPITLMGFGFLHEIAAAYALKFMTLRTFVPMVLKETPIIGWFVGWPKRFVDGYQRFWERVSWQLDVRLSCSVEGRIRRDDGKISLTVKQPRQDLNKTVPETERLEADYLILACPLTTDVSGELLALSDDERALFEQIQLVSYCMTTFSVKGLEIGRGVYGGPLAAVIDVDRKDLGEPWGVAKQWSDNDLVQIYTRTKWPVAEGEDAGIEEEVVRSSQRVIGQMKGISEYAAKWHTFDRWTYFQHVKPHVMKDGWYARLEKLQGQNSTFFVGGATNFELIESIGMYTKHLVDKHFPA